MNKKTGFKTERLLIALWSTAALAQAPIPDETLAAAIEASGAQKMFDGHLPAGVGSQGKVKPALTPLPVEVQGPVQAAAVPGFPGNLTAFGSQLFSRDSRRYVSPTDLPVPADYVVGPGDTVEVRLFGKENKVMRLEVDRSGAITMPDIGVVPVTGMTLETMGKTLIERIAKQKIGVEATVSMGQLRSIQVFLMGDVNYPGAITTDALTTVSNALLYGGGIKPSGSMRRIEIRRQGKVVSRIDLYESLIQGSSRGEIRLQPGDVVFVPTVGKRVGIDGEVMRPAVYELLKERTADDLVRLAGGFRPAAYPQLSRLNRIGRDWQRSTRMVSLASPGQRDMALQDGDVFDISAVVQTQRPSESDFRFRTVSLEGSVTTPGSYEWKEGLTLGDLLARSDQLAMNAYRPLALIERIEPMTGARSLLSANLAEVINQRKKVPLERDDRVFVLNWQEVDFLSSLQVQQVLAGKLPAMVGQGATGSVIDSQAPRLGGAQVPLSKGAVDVGDALKDTPRGGVKDQARDVSVCSGLVDLSQIVSTEGNSRFRAAVFPDALSDSEKRLVKSMPCPAVFDKNPAFLPYLLENTVVVRGEVKSPGLLPVPDGMSVKLALSARGGLTREADPNRVEVSQVSSFAGGLTQVVRQRLDKAEDAAALTVQAGDVIQVQRRASERETGLVKVSGEFMHPGGYEIRKGERLSELMARAGGLTSHAYPFGAVFLRNQVKEDKKAYYAKSASELQQNALFAMTRQTASAQAGSNGAAAVELIKQLKVTDPIGRMVIEADPEMLKAHPELDVVLEAGDEIYIPRRPSSVLVMGEVLNPGAVQFEKGKTAEEYIRAVGGVTRLADEGRIYAVLPNGSAEPVKLSSWGFGSRKLLPGSVIYVTREALPTTSLDLVQIATALFRDLAVSAASLVVIGK